MGEQGVVGGKEKQRLEPGIWRSRMVLGIRVGGKMGE